MDSHRVWREKNMEYASCTAEELREEKKLAEQEYVCFQKAGLSLDLSRGKPEPRQLDLSTPLLSILKEGDYYSEDGLDCRNYGGLEGIPEARRLFGEILGMPENLVLPGGNSSLALIHDALCRAFLHGPLPGDTPWSQLPKVKFVCPVPGYDWHFHTCENFGIEMLSVEIREDGPDMDRVEELVKDPAVKGMICVPMYGNPSGVTYSDEVVRRLAAMETGASDFRLIWDNAYCVHHLYDEEENRDHLANIYEACKAYGHEDRVLMFTSTSKITFAGGGICAMACSPANRKEALRIMKYQLVCYNKMNQLRHVRFLPDQAAVEAHMRKQAAILRPKFQRVDQVLRQEVASRGLGHWHNPRGGYFVCFYALPGCAKRIVELCREAGVTLTAAGAAYPYDHDPQDSAIRIAPSYAPMEELEQVLQVFTAAIRLASLEKLLG